MQVRLLSFVHRVLDLGGGTDGWFNLEGGTYILDNPFFRYPPLRVVAHMRHNF